MESGKVGPKKSEMDMMIEDIRNNVTLEQAMNNEAEGKMKKFDSIAGVFGLFESGTVVEDLKNRLGVKYPELMEFETNKSIENENDVFYKDCLAKYGLRELINNAGLSDFLMVTTVFTFSNPDILPGDVLIGAEFVNMKINETMLEFMGRVATAIASLGLHFKPHAENPKVVNEIDSEQEVETRNMFLTVMKESFYYYDYAEEFDFDDYDQGFRLGAKESEVTTALRDRVAMYKAHETTGLMKDEDFVEFMESFNNNIARFRIAPKHFDLWFDKLATFAQLHNVTMDEIGPDDSEKQKQVKK